MSRIRSIHPGLWTDEAFVGLSPMARLLLMGIWNECDDAGSFAWSPLTLKMKILPADNADAAALLEEMVSARIILRYEAGGKPYGAVRNFCQFQRPKKPNSVYPQTDEVREWVNITARSTRDGSEPVGNELPTNGEKSRQMEDGGEGDKGKSSVDKSTGGEPPDLLKAMFDDGLALLTSTGTPEKQARSLLGKWKKAKGEAEVLVGLSDCRAKRIEQPIEWLEKRFQAARYISPSGFEYRGDDEAVMRQAEKRADWNTYWAVKGGQAAEAHP